MQQLLTAPPTPCDKLIDPGESAVGRIGLTYRSPSYQELSRSVQNPECGLLVRMSG